MAALVFDDVALSVKHTLGAVSPNDPVLVNDRRTFSQCREYRTFGSLHVIRMNAFQKGFKSPPELTWFDAIDPVEFVGPAHCIRCKVPFEAADVRHLLRLLKQRLAAGQPFLCLVLISDVEC